MENSAIEWTDHTFNPWIGCVQISPGCDNCYAERWDRRFAVSGHAMRWGAGVERTRTSAANWRQPLRWDANALRAGRRARVFCASLADVFDNEVPFEWRRDLFRMIAATQHLDWLLLTKRIGNARSMLDEVADSYGMTWGAHWKNVWIGATVVNQEEADRDIPKLLATPASRRFLSIEPMLGDVRLGSYLQRSPSAAFLAGRCTADMPAWTRIGSTSIDWVIVGGESGRRARPMHPDWVRRVRDECAIAHVPFFFKQWGEWTPGENVERPRGVVDVASFYDGRWISAREDLSRDDGHRDDEPDLYHVGKRAAGRTLDGRTWDQVPA